MERRLPLGEDLGHAAARDQTEFLLDHLVGAQQNRWGYLKTERRGGLAVHDHLELGRELHRKIARLLAAQDAIHVGGSSSRSSAD